MAPATRTPADPAVVRMKPQHQRLELDIPVCGGEHLDEEAEGRANIRRMTYASSRVPHHGQPVIGVVKDGTLWLPHPAMFVHVGGGAPHALWCISCLPSV
mgnify:CR=1 FL=1